MKLSDCYYLGYISSGSSRGSKLTIKLDTDNPEYYKKLESVLIQMNTSDQTPVPFFIDKFLRLAGNELSLEIRLNNQLPDTTFLKGKQVYLPLSHLPELKGNKFYYHEIIGFNVEDKVKGSIGKVKDIFDGNAHPILVVMNGEKEILLPLNDSVVERLDKSSGVIYVTAPDGLVDLYLS